MYSNTLFQPKTFYTVLGTTNLQNRIILSKNPQIFQLSSFTKDLQESYLFCQQKKTYLEGEPFRESFPPLLFRLLPVGVAGVELGTFRGPGFEPGTWRGPIPVNGIFTG